MRLLSLFTAALLVFLACISQPSAAGTGAIDSCGVTTNTIERPATLEFEVPGGKCLFCGHPISCAHCSTAPCQLTVATFVDFYVGRPIFSQEMRQPQRRSDFFSEAFRPPRA